jgi:hypothetical protein
MEVGQRARDVHVEADDWRARRPGQSRRAGSYDLRDMDDDLNALLARLDVQKADAIREAFGSEGVRQLGIIRATTAREQRRMEQEERRQDAALIRGHVWSPEQQAAIRVARHRHMDALRKAERERDWTIMSLAPALRAEWIRLRRNRWARSLEQRERSRLRRAAWRARKAAEAR